MYSAHNHYLAFPDHKRNPDPNLDTIMKMRLILICTEAINTKMGISIKSDVGVMRVRLASHALSQNPSLLNPNPYPNPNSSNKYHFLTLTLTLTLTPTLPQPSP